MGQIGLEDRRGPSLPWPSREAEGLRLRGSSTLLVVYESSSANYRMSSQRAPLGSRGLKMCGGCFNQLFLRDEFHSGGLAGLPRQRGGHAYPAGVYGLFGRLGLRADRRWRFSGLRSGRRRRPHSAAEGRSVRWPARQPPPRSRSRAARCLRLATTARCQASRLATLRSSILTAARCCQGLSTRTATRSLASLVFELLDDVGYAKYPTRENLVAHLKHRKRLTPRTGNGSSDQISTIFCRAGIFTRTELDAISADHPIFVWYTNGHDACVNSEALNAAGIPEDVGDLPGGGSFRPER